MYTALYPSPFLCKLCLSETEKEGIKILWRREEKHASSLRLFWKVISHGDCWVIPASKMSFRECFWHLNESLTHLINTWLTRAFEFFLQAIPCLNNLPGSLKIRFCSSCFFFFFLDWVYTCHLSMWQLITVINALIQLDLFMNLCSCSISPERSCHVTLRQQHALIRWKLQNGKHNGPPRERENVL